jgi:hypothetical protein
MSGTLAFGNQFWLNKEIVDLSGYFRGQGLTLASREAEERGKWETHRERRSPAPVPPGRTWPVVALSRATVQRQAIWRKS